ncbi:MAG: ankyrin repeat domain-containing protein [Candidatus Paceibacterota bacterium]|jgi:hypothetical protein
MSILARIEVDCNDEKHHISAWEPGDEEECGAEHVTYGSKGYIICYEDHDADMDLTLEDLGVPIPCFLLVERSVFSISSSLERIRYSLEGPILKEFFSKIIISICAGADIHIEDDAALRLAARCGNLPMVGFLIANGANIHARNNAALLSSAYYGHSTIIRLLIKHGANIHTMDDAALRWAAINNHLETVRILVEGGANIHSRNDDALQGAIKNGHHAVAAYLRKKTTEEKQRGTS